MFRWAWRTNRIQWSARGGMSIVEALIVMVVFMVALWAIMSTVASSTELHVTAKEHINARIFTTSWFEAFEAVNPEPFDQQFSMTKASEFVAGVLDRNFTGSYPSYVIQGYKVFVQGDEKDAAINGVRNVTLRVTLPNAASKVKPLTFQRQINARSSETVSDDRLGG